MTRVGSSGCRVADAESRRGVQQQTQIEREKPMINLIKRRLNTFDQVVDFGDEHPLTPAIAAITVLYTQVGTVAIELRGHAGDQDGGIGQFRAGSTSRRAVADELRDLMRPVNQIARALDRDEHPGVREQFLMPRSSSYEALISRAQAFLDAIAPIKTLFTGRGMAADFDTELAAAKEDLVAATDQKNAGRLTHVGGTAGLLAKSRTGVKYLRELDALLSYQYRNDPVLLATWKSACHIERDPVTENAVETPPVGGVPQT
jgi:hypothetical protein